MPNLPGSITDQAGLRSLLRAAAQALRGRQLISLPGPLFSPGLEHRPPHDGVGRFGLPMLQAESAEIGALQQCPRDGRRIVPAEIPSAPADLVVQLVIWGRPA